MASFSGSSAIVAAAMIVQFLAVAAKVTAPPPTPTPTKFIDTVCRLVSDKTYCLETLTNSPSAVSANGLIPLAKVVIGLGKAHANNTMAFIGEVTKKADSKKDVLTRCRKAYEAIAASFCSAEADLNSSPKSANYEIMVTLDKTRQVTGLVGKCGDLASKTLLAMNDQMNRFINLGTGATIAVDDHYENPHTRPYQFGPN